ncbi:MAG: hypothetical protein IKL16_01500 [Clostridia bacterium]|nr:hypothetical protein [Clostridia bacterium]
MVVALSYVIAIILTIALAILLYPISAFFWLLGLLGKIADKLFVFTNGAIKSLWRDIRNGDQNTVNQWVCSCGSTNSGEFCSECGKPHVAEKTPEISGDKE